MVRIVADTLFGNQGRPRYNAQNSDYVADRFERVRDKPGMTEGVSPGTTKRNQTSPDILLHQQLEVLRFENKGFGQAGGTTGETATEHFDSDIQAGFERCFG